MSFCAKCGKELAPNANFCHSCGSPVASSSRVNHYSFKLGDGTPRIVVSNHSAGSIDVAQGSTTGEVTVDFDVREPNFHDYAAVQSDDLVSVRCRAARGQFWPAVVVGPRADIAVRVPPRVAALDLDCRFGGVSVSGVQGSVTAETLTGDIRLRDCEGSFVDARSKAGLIVLENVNGRVSARVSAGSIIYSGSLSPGDSWFGTRVGNVDLTLLGELNLTIDASTRVGRVNVDSAINATRLRSEEYMVGHRASLVIGTGANRLFAESGTGTISIRTSHK